MQMNNLKFVISITALVSIFGCRNWDVEKQYGIFTYLEHWEENQLDWEGGNTRVVYETLCAKEIDICYQGDPAVNFSHPKIHNESWTIDRRAPWLIVYPSSDKNETATFFNALSGKKLICEKCDSEFNKIGFKFSDLIWTHNSSRLYFEQNQAPFKELVFGFLEFSDNGVDLRYFLKESGETREESPVVRTLLDSNRFAWIYCDRKCILNEYLIDSNTVTKNMAECLVGDAIFFRTDGPICVTEKDFFRLNAGSKR